MTILVVDPLGAEREPLEGILAGLGHEVLGCGSAGEALRRAAQHPPLLAIVADGLPDMDSAALCERLRAHPDLQYLPVVLVLEREEMAAQRVLESAADDYLTRPFDARAVEARVRLVLHQARKHLWFETLRQACDLLAEVRDLHGAFVGLTRCLRRVLPIDHFVVALEEEGEVALEVVEAGAPGVVPFAFRERLSCADACPLRLADHGRRYVICDRVGDKDPKLAQGMRSCICLPLREGGRRLGALSLSSAQPEAFGAAQLPYLEALAMLVAHTVASVERYRQAKSEAERLAVIVREVHHRIKNNLQGVISLLARHREAQPDLAPAVNRVVAQLHAVAEVHNLLSRHARETVQVHALVAAIGQALQPLCGQCIQYDLLPKTDRLVVSAAEAVPLALVLNELIQNAIDHGYPDGRAGTIRIVFEETPTGPRLAVADDGVPPGPPEEIGHGLGLALVRSLLPAKGAAFRLYRDGMWTVAEVNYRPAAAVFATEGQVDAVSAPCLDNPPA